MAELKCRIPNINELIIHSRNNECGSLHQFLLHCVPYSLKKLYISCSACALSLPCNSLCSGYAEAIKAATQIVCLHNWVISGSAFEAIFKAASQTRQLKFKCCQIDSSGKLDLDGPEYKWVLYRMMHYQYLLI